MRGFPLINALVIFMALGFLLLPLVHLTRSTPLEGGAESGAGGAAADAEGHALLPADAGVPVAISVRYAHAPKSLTLSHLGEIVWQVDSPEVMAEGHEVALKIPPEGIDLVVGVVWPEGTPESAIEIRLEPEMLREQLGTLWGEGEVEDVLSFVWEEMGT